MAHSLADIDEMIENFVNLHSYFTGLFRIARYRSLALSFCR
jgi:hypothetical protein